MEKNEENIVLKFKPKQGLLFRLSDLITIPFTLLILTFSSIWTKESFQLNLAFTLFGFFFIIISFTYAFLRFFIDSYHRKNTEYILTQNEIIIKSKLLFKRTTEVDLKSINGIELYEYSKGYGNIYFGKKDPFDFYNFNGFHWTNDLFGRKLSYTILEYVPNSKEIYDLIRKQKTIANTV